MKNKFYGKYQGLVTNNLDPMQIGRVKVQVPDIFRPDQHLWAMPCVPCSLPQKIGSSLPKTGAKVWIEFEQGDADRPIWTGCFYGSSAETPPSLRNTK